MKKELKQKSHQPDCLALSTIFYNMLEIQSQDNMGERERNNFH